MRSPFDAMRAQVRATMERLAVPGAAFGVIAAGTTMADGLGVTSVDHPLPVGPDTLFQIGSITKTVTGTAALALVDQGRLDLDAPVRRYLPGLRLRDEPTAAALTLRHLLTHTAGFVGDLFLDTGWGADALARYVERMAELEQVAPLGALWSYCNAGYALIGRAIEAATGQSVERAIGDLALAPCGMGRASFFPWEIMTDAFAVGHRSAEGRASVLRPWPIPRSASAVGALACSVVELLRYAERHLAPAPALAAMQVSQGPAGNSADWMGLGWLLRDYGGLRLVHHGGATNGQMAQLTLVPARGFAVALLTNSDRGGALSQELVPWALEAFLGVAEPAPAFLTLSPAELGRYAGRYRAALTHVEVSVRGGELWAQAIPQGGFPERSSPPGPTPPPVRLAFTAEDRVLALDAPYKGQRAEFISGEGGAVAWLRFGHRAHRRAPSA